MELRWWGEFFSVHWGDLASVASLVIASITLWVAKKAREAAEGARELAKRRNLAEELQELQNKIEQVGIFLRDNKWDLVHLRAQEIVGGCSTLPSRWKKELSAESRGNIILAREQVRSIAAVALRAPRTPPQARELRQVERAQQRAHELLSGELGVSLVSIEGPEA